MCGITGIYRFDGGNVDYSLLKQMTDAVTHRGPDDEGQYIDKNAGFGHRRLSIIDLSKVAAKKLEMINSGIANVKIEVITPSDLNMMINAHDSLFRMPKSDTAH